MDFEYDTVEIKAHDRIVPFKQGTPFIPILEFEAGVPLQWWGFESAISASLKCNAGT